MNKPHQRSSNVAVDQILENMSPNLHGSDGQYVQLGFTPPSTPAEQHLWSQHPKPSNGNAFYPPYGFIEEAPQPVYSTQPSVPFNYPMHPNLYMSEGQGQRFEQPNDLPIYQPTYSLFMSQDVSNRNLLASNENYYNGCHSMPSLPPNQNSNPNLIENVVGNWVPNTTGTYSPFGGTHAPNQIIDNLFSKQTSTTNHFNNMHILKESNQTHLPEKNKKDDIVHFHFNRDMKKPRAIAEVKPMQQPVVKPSYSDVLAKSVPQSGLKPGKIDLNLKSKKENTKKLSKNEKISKNVSPKIINGTELKTDKSSIMNNKNNQKNSRISKIPQLNRKWASLDNVNEPLCDEHKRRKFDDSYNNTKNINIKNNQQKPGKRATDFEDVEVESNKSDTLNVSKSSRKGSKNSKPRNNEYTNEKGTCRRTARNRKRNTDFALGFVGRKIKEYMPGWWKILVTACLWLFHLISDTVSLSIHLSHDLYFSLYTWLCLKWVVLMNNITCIGKRIQVFSWIKGKFRKEIPISDSNRFSHLGLQHNIAMPTTGEEAMKRLLACKGKDPYSILGLTPLCTDDDIKRYYKKQAFLVHPDKNQQPGAEEAFKILVHAFNMIGEPEHRANYDRGVAESAQVEQAWSELTELLAQLQKKVEAAANTIRCSACGSRHKRIKMDRPCYAARHCGYCKIHHSAREGDIWAEAKFMGFFWHYYACMEGGVYDITEWAGCQKESLKHLKPDSHQVQYRIALGKQNSQSRKQNPSPRNEPAPDLENLLNTLYGNQDSSQGTRRKNKKTNKQ